MTEDITKIREMIELLAKEGNLKELKTVHEMVSYREDWSRPFGNLDKEKELRSLNDIFYFLNGLLRGLQIKKTWC
jgi:hypothetical protein